MSDKEKIATSTEFRVTGKNSPVYPVTVDLPTLLNTFDILENFSGINTSSSEEFGSSANPLPLKLPPLGGYVDNATGLQDTSSKLSKDRNTNHTNFLEQNKFAVRLKSLANSDVVAFRVSPEISETRSAAYKSVDPVHMPGSIQVYTNSAPRTWNMSSIKLISRNGAEAEINLATVNQLRSWMMPFFGATDTTPDDLNYGGIDMLGAPPEVLSFTAYSTGANNIAANIRNIPVVMTTLNIPYPTDVDYIKTAETNQPFPSIMQIDMILVETHSPTELSNFDLIKYRNGMLQDF